MPMNLHYGDILDLEVDAIVNAANTELQHGGSLAATLVSAGGPSIQEESDRIGWCDLGSAVATTAGSLRASHVVHVPTVDYKMHRGATLDEISGGSRAALDIARELGCHSIAFPLLGTGLAGLKPDQVAPAMMAMLADSRDLETILVVHWQCGWRYTP